MTERWKYKVVDVRQSRWFATRPTAEDMQTELDRLGSQGWELVSVIALPVTSAPRLILKRPA